MGCNINILYSNIIIDSSATSVILAERLVDVIYIYNHNIIQS